MLIGPVLSPSMSRIRPSTLNYLKDCFRCNQNNLLMHDENLVQYVLVIQLLGTSLPCQRHNRNSGFVFQVIGRSRAHFCMKERENKASDGFTVRVQHTNRRQ